MLLCRRKRIRRVRRLANQVGRPNVSRAFPRRRNFTRWRAARKYRRGASGRRGRATQLQKRREKFWTDEGAEAILQLRADYLSDDEPLEGFWQRRQEAVTGQRRYRRCIPA
jgi:hypothetical protein